MAVFQYEAMSSDGKSVREEIEANTSEDAIAKIRSRGYFVTKMREKSAAKAAKSKGQAVQTTTRRPAGAGGLLGGGVSKKLLTQFTRQLSTLQDAGLTLLRSLRILEQQQKPGTMRLVLRQVADDVEGGASLSEAMAKHKKVFDRLYVNMVNAGETGGVLDLILNRLAEFMEKAQRLKRRVIGAMIYPAAVIGFSSLIVLGIMLVVVPKFKQIFKDFGAELPGVTQALIDISDWLLYDFGWLIIIAIPVVFVIVTRIVRLTYGGRYFLDSVKLKIPIFGQILSKTGVGRFTRTLGTLISAGVPILEALQITKETAGNEVFSSAMGEVHDSIREGESFAGPLRAKKVCDNMVVNMIDVGEETGELDKMLMKVADNYDEDVDTLIGSLVSMLEPVMVVTLGLIVGGIVIALFMPMVTLIGSVTGGG